MSGPNIHDDVAPIEMLPAWEGPAQLNPSVFAGPKELEEFLADSGRIEEAAVWVRTHSRAATAGIAECEPTKIRVVGFLSAWLKRHGTAKLDELRQSVLKGYERGNADPAEVRRRIDALFAEAAG